MSARSFILDGTGQPAITAERVVMEKELRYNPLRNWTPDVLVRQLEAYARGDMRELAWVMQWLEDHDETVSVVAAKAAVARQGFDVVLRDQIRPEQRGMAEDQRGVLQAFYDAIETTHAIEADEVGNMRLLAQQTMDGYGKGRSAHHVVWRPTSEGLRATLIYVPPWFFETRTGRMRFLQSEFAIQGVPLESMGGRNAWMISKGRGVMLACALCRMFKGQPMQDWLTYCDRHAMPAFLGKTGSAQGTTGWNAMYNAVRSMGAEFGAVINTSDAIEVLDLSTKGELPYEKLVDKMTRAIVILWRGGDLSTLSKGDGVGSNPQQEEMDELDGDNAAWVSETIDRQLSRTVLDYHFGPGTPQLAELKLRTRSRDNLTQDLAVVKEARGMGVRVSASWFVSKFNIVEAAEDERALGESAAPTPAPGPAVNPAGTSVVNSGDFQALLTTTLAKALGVRPAILAPITPLISHLSERAQDSGTSDADFLQLVEDAAMSLPELFDSKTAAELATELEAAMGTAALQGARDALRDAKTEPTTKP